MRPLFFGCRWAVLALLCCVAFCPASAQLERNNWAVLVETSRYWYNYRHSSNVLTYYHTIKRLGIPDSQIIVMMSEDMACNPRNVRPGTIFNDHHHHINLYGEDVEVDYRGDEVSVDNFIRLLTGRHPPGTPRNKRLLTDSMSNIFVFITGHSGDEFIKFQDWEEITSTDIADAFAQMDKQQRYRKIFWVSDTCQAATLQNQFYSPNIIGIGSSGKKENSYSHHVDHELGVAVVDRFSYYGQEYLNRLTTSSKETVQTFKDWFNPKLLHSNPEMRSDLFEQLPKDILMTDFLASTGKMRFQGEPMLQLTRHVALGNASLQNGGTGGAASCPSTALARKTQAASTTASEMRPPQPDIKERLLVALAIAIRTGSGGSSSGTVLGNWLPSSISAEAFAGRLRAADKSNTEFDPSAGALALLAFVGLAALISAVI